jgi:arylsulfatase A-like enzyme
VGPFVAAFSDGVHSKAANKDIMHRTLRPLFLYLFLLASLLTAAPKPPNILFIAVDDLRPELGCYGEKTIRSPHIDRLAASGVTFNRAYCQLAVCNPSRASIMTGLRPDSIRVWDLKTNFREPVPEVVTLPQTFMQHGYHAASFGKIYHNPWPDNPSWSEPHAWPEKSTLWSDAAKARHAVVKDAMREQGRSEEAIRRIRPQATEIVDFPDEEHIDGAIAEQALAAMRRLAKGDKPFFLAAGFIRPHLPFVVPRKYWEMYDAEAIPAAANPVLPKDAPPFAMNTMYELRDYLDFADTPDPRGGSLTLAQQRRLKHGYYASVSFVDALVGKLVDELEKLGLDQHTIVVLWGDHGWKLGEHNSWCKQSNYEIDARVPLIIRAPGMRAKGQRTDALVELLDVYPTLCELAGLTIPASLEGRSMVPLLSDTGLPWKSAAYHQFPRRGARPLMGYAMRTADYRYVEWQDRRDRSVVASELYDQQNDPQENVNIAAAHPTRIAELRQEMWATLPAAPLWSPEPKRRPQVVFCNQRDEPVTLFWLEPEGGERRQAVIPPGESLIQQTTLGHRFRARGASGVVQDFSVKKAKQTFVIKPGQKNAADTAPAPGKSVSDTRPNIVFCMADDWSAPHASALGDRTVKTPNFDRVAREGVLFPNAFVSTPSCTPSRLSILTGQHHWRLREGANLGGSLRESYPVYTELLQQAGYRLGRYGKGVWPSKHTFRNRDSFGEQSKSFDAFVDLRKPGEPFCFWHGGQDPHRPYELGIGERSGISLDHIKVPTCLPDHPVVRGDLADYYWEVQRFDREVGAILKRLETMGELENTIVVVSGDNGMPFPRGKATLYDLGTRVPLAIRWGARVPGNRTLEDFVTLCDLAPTFLEAAGLTPEPVMTGRSLMPILLSKKSGQVDPARTFVLTGNEQHCFLYPSRALRSKDFLYIRNVDPQSWSSGAASGPQPQVDFAKTPWPTGPGAFSYNVDPGPSKQLLLEHRAEYDTFAELCFDTRTERELYDLAKDPDQLHNLSGRPAYRSIQQRLERQLTTELIKSEDPRMAEPGYTDQLVEGWVLRVSDTLRQQKPEATNRAVQLLGDQLKGIRAVVTAQALARLQSVPFWFSPIHGGIPRGEYHPDIGWLRANQHNPAKALGVEFSNIPIFEQEIERMPMMVLHELAHAYHHQVLQFEHPEILSAYQTAKKSGIYDEVARKNAHPQKAYAIESPMEYFAETTEAYFGMNDYYPFNRSELEQHDPRMFELLKQIWSE